ncbi:relaxase domain-containing protein [Nesterenkonia alkaliphila]|uniref:Relaxase domain-containing protein n=2 Tax=Nesterenkonia alkaliphila TaxID=1463631 RepID=A0A7K1UL16_9MICC|nr:relaxase domain-containing protein [Nesterenkonia alkaliphila]
MSSGSGYEYLLKSVATADVPREAGTSLTRYYTESGCPPGTWTGHGLNSLDTGQGTALAAGDTVTEEHLEKLLGRGVHPLTGSKLGLPYPKMRSAHDRIATRIARLPDSLTDQARGRAIEEIRNEEIARKQRKAVAGFDLTFSPPKSVSVLWGVADAATQSLVAEAHHAAVRETLAVLEARVAATRVGHGGLSRMPVTGVIAAGFDHYDSRAADPQLHTHLVVSNKVQGVDGRWRSLDSRTLHRATVALSATYNALLADHTTRMLGVSWTEVDRGKDRNPGWEIDGVPAELIASFSQRSIGTTDGAEGIAQATRRLIDEYTATHGHAPSKTAIARLRQQATLETRPEKELHSLAELTAKWRARATELVGEDATFWVQRMLTRNSHTAVRADHLTSKQISNVVEKVLIAVGDRRVTWSRWNLHAEAMRQLMNIRFATTEERTMALDRVVHQAEASSVRLSPGYDRPVPEHYLEVEGTNRFQPADQIAYTSQKILDAEHRLLEHADHARAPDLYERRVRRHSRRKVDGVQLTADQASAVIKIARSRLTLDLLVGPAGSGKTTALRALQRAWVAEHGKSSVIGLAPSATAAEVLGESLDVRAENTAKFLYEHDKGRWDLAAGQLVLLDEASLAGTLTLDRITTHATKVGAKVVLVGDWAQLASVETGGAFGMLVRHRDRVPTLTGIHRFTHNWEKKASMDLRRGKTSALDTYEDERRLHDGEIEDMLDALYQAWQADRETGHSTLMIAGNAETVAALNQRARADLITTGHVEEQGVTLRDGTAAGRGDLIVTRRNERRLTTGSMSWVKNGDRWRVDQHGQDGSLTVRRLGKGDQPHGTALMLPARYVAEHVELGYATTAHRAQGSTVDTAHALIDPDSASRELLYVAMTRGRESNHAYVVQPDPHEPELHLDPPEELTRAEQLARTLARSDTDLSATETLKAETDRHASLKTLMDEYDVLAREAEHERWETLLDVAPFTPDVSETVFTSPYYERLEAALSRHEADGHNVTRILTLMAPSIGAGEDHDDPAAKLANIIEKATHTLTRQRDIRPRVGGLIPTPSGPLEDDIQTALTARQKLIEAGAHRLLGHALDTDRTWTKHLGTPPMRARARAAWMESAATIALYRHRYDIEEPAPLGDVQQIRGSDQATQKRHAAGALRSILAIRPQTQPDARRDASRRDEGRSL